MADKTGIEWCDSTFNPWTGCTKVGPGCDHCYAEGWSKRSGTVQWGPHAERRRTTGANWRKPLQWEREHAAFQAEYGRRRRVFCASLADVFDNQVPEQWRVDLFRLIEATPNLDWLLLTKRVGNARGMMDRVAGLTMGISARTDWTPLPNIWLGATVVNQQEADRDVPKLLQVPARVRFLSIEPMLGPIDLTCVAWPEIPGHRVDALRRGYWNKAGLLACGPAAELGKLDWVICGGESGPGARPMHPDWARSLRDQCAAAGVPFLFKQWGEWADEHHAQLDQPIASRLRKTVSKLTIDGRVVPMRRPNGPEHYAGIYRVGKAAAGRLLDGVEHNGFPEDFR